MKIIFNIFCSVGIVIIFLVSLNVNAKINTEGSSLKASALNEKRLIEELTGKKDLVRNSAYKNLKKSPIPVQHFRMGQKAVTQKNYILAIKHFNTILKRYPHSAAVKPTLVAKAKLYQEMGLQPQSIHNLKMSQQKNPLVNKNKMVARQMKAAEKVKVIK